MRIKTFTAKAFVQRPIADVFEFCSRPENLEKLTSTNLHFHLRTPAVEMRVGARVGYDVRVHGFPVHWISEIVEWNPPYQFKDVQVQGPYKVWEHLHQFMERDGGTVLTDTITYAMVGGFFFGSLVQRDMERIFAYRNERLAELIDASR